MWNRKVKQKRIQVKGMPKGMGSRLKELKIEEEERMEGWAIKTESEMWMCYV